MSEAILSRDPDVLIAKIESLQAVAELKEQTHASKIKTLEEEVNKKQGVITQIYSELGVAKAEIEKLQGWKRKMEPLLKNVPAN